MNKEIYSIIKKRESKYGNFKDYADLTQELKSVIRQHHNFENLPPAFKESTEMIFHKLARLINGDHTDEDSILDIIGYAKLYLDYVREGEN